MNNSEDGRGSGTWKQSIKEQVEQIKNKHKMIESNLTMLVSTLSENDLQICMDYVLVKKPN